jgi:hypothetical protein
MYSMRPVLQTFTSIIAQPGYVESDFLLVASTIDRLSDSLVVEETTRELSEEEHRRALDGLVQSGFTPQKAKSMLPNRPHFRGRVEKLTDMVAPEVWVELSVDLESWLQSLVRHRNLFAHALEQRQQHRDFVEGVGIRALRDSSIAVLVVILINHLGVNPPAITFAAKRLRFRYTKRYTFGQIRFTNTGFTEILD